jgi:signal transduction histidine kinase
MAMFEDIQSDKYGKATFRAIIDVLPGFKFLLNQQGVFVDFFLSEGTPPTIWGMPSVLMGKHLEDVLPAYLSKALSNNIERAIKKKNTQSFEFPYHYNNLLQSFEAQIIVLNSQRILLLITPVEKQKRDDQKNKATSTEQTPTKGGDPTNADSNFYLENFAHTVSHDLREPVRTMNSFAQLLKRRYLEQLDQDAHDYLDFIVSAASHMNKLITDLLEYSVTSNAETALSLTEVDTQALVNDVLTSLTDVITDTDTRIEIPNPLPTLIADRTQLRQVFQNLISNAIKFRKKDVAPHIQITAKKKDNHWQFTIRDYGIGIKEENFDKIFILFRRLHSKRVYPGSGIGLSLCKKVIEQHGGKIWVESTLGEGASFYFTLPINK